MSIYPDPPRQTLADLDPESLTTDGLITLAHSHRQGEAYPTPEQLLVHLPTVLRALSDYLLSGNATALDAAYRIASIVDAIEGVQMSTVPAQRRH